MWNPLIAIQAVFPFLESGKKFDALPNFPHRYGFREALNGAQYLFFIAHTR